MTQRSAVVSPLLLNQLVELHEDHLENVALIKFLQEAGFLKFSVVFFLKRKDSQHLQERNVKVLVIGIKLKTVRYRIELLKILALAQEQLN